jgi:HEAT repeat protein
MGSKDVHSRLETSRSSCATWIGVAGLLWAVTAAAGCKPLLGYTSDLTRQAELVKSLDSDSADVRIAALEDLRKLEAGEIPQAVDELVQDADPRVRRAAVAVVAARRHPDAPDLLLAALEDPDVQVRLAAVSGLGETQDAKSRQALEYIMRGDTEMMRTAAIAALAAQGAADLVRGASDDKSWRVRSAVAAGLARDATADAGELALRLVEDRSAQVQQQAVQAVAAWPLDLAGPVLLAAAASPAYMTSKTAIEQLRERWPAARGLPSEPPPGLSPGELSAWHAERGRHVAELRSQWIAEYGNRLMVAGRDAVRNAVIKAASPEAIAEAEKLVAALTAAGQTAEQTKASLDSLRAMGGDLVAVADAWAREQPPKAIPEAVYKEVLPELALVIATINELSSTDVTVRRQTAAKLAELAAHEALSPAAVARLAMLVEKEQDAIVWQTVLRVVSEPDATGVLPANRQLIVLALGHPLPDVRRRACEALANWNDPRMSSLLVASLGDTNASVVAAAAKAFAVLGAGDDPRPLLPLLALGDRTLRLSAAEALARSRYREGVDALERLAIEADANVRRQAALAMGRTRDAHFTQQLIRMLDDRSGVQQAALESLAAIHGRDFGRENRGAATTVAERAASWKRWHADRVSARRNPSDVQ